MTRANRFLATALIWIAVSIGAAVLWLAHQHGHHIVQGAATAFDDPRPGERVKATPEKMRRAQETWRKRRAE